MFESYDYERFFFPHRPIFLFNFFFNEQNQLFFSPAWGRVLPSQCPWGLEDNAEGKSQRPDPVTNLPPLQCPLCSPIPSSFPRPHRAEAGPPAEPAPPPLRQVRVTAGARGRSGRAPALLTRGERGSVGGGGVGCVGGCVREWEKPTQTTSESAFSCAAYRAEEVRSSPHSRDPLLGRYREQTPEGSGRGPALPATTRSPAPARASPSLCPARW